MEIKKDGKVTFYRFTSIMYCLLAFIFTGGLSVATVGLIGLSWAGTLLEVLGIMSGVIAVVLALILMFVSMIFIAVHTAVVLWNKNKYDNSICFLYQILWGFFTLISICIAVGINIIAGLNILINIAYFLLIIGIPILGIIAFSIGRVQPDIKENAVKVQESLPQRGIRAVRGDYAGAIFTLKDNEILTLGTSPGYCQILFNNKKISRRHCIVSFVKAKNEYMLIDCSKNGTYLMDGTRIPQGVPYRCLPGMVFELDKQKQVFQFI